MLFEHGASVGCALVCCRGREVWFDVVFVASFYSGLAYMQSSTLPRQTIKPIYNLNAEDIRVANPRRYHMLLKLLTIPHP